ncbi:M15 family metallopeptidase [Sphingomonas sp.]|jgi:hypothetical protein|uniref:M15 family metallopeptidase n=1 Tax=Sphingomonas sp. TaxID=28214 RepID=UPI002E2F8789|nr:M15 family metallopeptidase [Sphingomonas sp.]HEX4693105.1 M15 family metallopeptidase [Sphingomonas sp.]
MPISLDGLDPAFRTKLETCLTHCGGRGTTMVPYFGIRTPVEQGGLWRQSRSTAEIAAKTAELKTLGAPFLAHCIDAAGPRHGPHVTNAAPGFSWHQWGEAMDCYWLVDGKAEWSTEIGGPDNGYRIYADQATKDGLTAGGYWLSLKDWPHVQKRVAASPASAGLAIAEINAKMEAMYGSG